jgi:adenosylcobinamide-phosphate synthase
MNEWLVLGAFGLDLVFGEPRYFTHPVVWIGRLVERLELVLAAVFIGRKLTGVLLALLTLVISGGVAWGLLALAGAIHPVLETAVTLWMAYTTLALHSLHQESREVVRQVESGNLEEARRALALIVSRQTSGLDEEQILKACIETVAENTSDAVIGPLFYLFLGGPVLAIVYKTVSTLDSMVGYVNDRYRELGWASARLDDLLNLIPARLTGTLMVLAAAPLGLNPWGSLKAMLRDARKHKSPNAGFPEAAAAGALGVQLGGPAVYFGERVEKPTLGDDDRPVTVARYRAMVRLMYLSSLLALGLGFLTLWLLR